MNDQTDRDLQTYHSLLGLWQSENPIKTIKLQFLLATNALLAGFLSIANEHITLLCLGGAALNLIWTFSIGRTSLFQKAWKNKLDEIASRYPNDTRFQILAIKDTKARAPGWLRVLGGISSKYYLLGAPVSMSISWLLLALSA